jgi:hypothetical protein
MPLLEAICTRVKNALPTSSSLKLSRPAARALASQVCSTKQKATMNRAMIIALPAALRLPVDSSAMVEMPSKPRKLSTAIDRAPAMSGPLTLAESQSGAVFISAPGMVPLFSAVTAMMTKITMKTTSMARKTRFISLIDVMPSRLMTVLIATKISAHIQRGDSGKMPTIDSAANT